MNKDNFNGFDVYKNYDEWITNNKHIVKIIN